MKKSKLIFAIVASILIVGCSTNNIENLVPDNVKEDLSGTYYSVDGVLEVSDELVKWNDLELKPTKFVLENFNETINSESKSVEHVVAYLKEGKNKYRLYFKGQDFKYQLSLEQKTGDSYKEVATFMPSIEEFNGAYTGYGDSHKGNIVFHIGNNFNFYRGFFDIGVKSPSTSLFNDSWYAESFKTVTDIGMVTLITINDYVDHYTYYTVFLGKINNTVGLVDLDYGIIDFYYDPMFLTYPFFASENDTFSAGSITPSKNSVTIGDKSYAYENTWTKEEGHVVNLVNGTRVINVKPTQTGMIWTEKGVSKEYVYDSVDYLLGKYKYEDKTFLLEQVENGYQVSINNESVPFEFVVYNHQKSVKVTLEDGDYYFSPFKQSSAIIGNTPSGEKFYVNQESYSSLYATSYVNKEIGRYEELEVTNDFLVSYKGSIVESNLFYDPRLEYPYIEFELDNTKYTFSYIESSTGIARLTYNNESKDFFVKEKVEALYDSYTSHHENDLSIDKYRINYYGTTVDYYLEAYYFEYSFTYLMSIKFEIDNLSITGFSNTHMVAFDVEDENGVIKTTSYISTSEFEDLVGTYYLEGTFGPEKFKLTSDGHFYADTVNNTNSGLIYDIEYDYSLTMTYGMDGNSYPTIIFHATETQSLNLVKIGDKLTLNMLNYIADYLFKFNGVYVDSFNSSVIELRGDELYINGSKAIIEEVKYNEYGTFITATDGGYTETFSFYDYGEDGTYLYTENSVEYTKSNFDFSSLLGSYTSNDKTYTLSQNKIPGTGIKNGFVLSDGSKSYTSYKIVMYNGYLSLQFETDSEIINIYSTSDGNKINVISLNFPPPPPPPPLPPDLGF